MAGANQPCDQWLGLTGSILIGFDRAGCECFVTEALCATFQRDRISEVENPVKGYGARN